MRTHRQLWVRALTHLAMAVIFVSMSVGLAVRPLRADRLLAAPHLHAAGYERGVHTNLEKADSVASRAELEPAGRLSGPRRVAELMKPARSPETVEHRDRPAPLFRVLTRLKVRPSADDPFSC